MESLERELSAIKAVVEVIGQAHQTDEALDRILRVVCELKGADDGAIGFVQEGGDAVQIRAAYNMPSDELGSVYRSGEGLAGQVLLSGSAMRFERYGELPGAGNPELAENAVIGVPVVWRGDTVGFFGLGKRPPSKFGADDVDQLADFAAYAAIAIVEARARADSNKLVNELNQLYRLGQSLTVVQSVPEAVGAFLRHIAGTTSFASTVALLDHDYPQAVKVVGRWSPQEGLSLAEFLVPSTRGPIDAELDAGKIVAIGNVFEDDRCGAELRAIQGESGRAALALFPLEGPGERLGSVVLSVVEPRNWQPAELELFETAVVMLGASIHSQRASSENTESERRLAQLQVRQGLARELHDSICQTLFAISLVAQSIDSGIAEEGSVRRLVDLSREALADMRHMVRELAPTEGELATGDAGFARLRNEGLVNAVSAHVSNLRAAGRDVSLSVQAGFPERMRHGWPLLCAIQEALGNALRHANANRIDVALECADETVRVTILDDGIGFEVGDGGRESDGLGLASMRDRMANVSGHFVVRSQPGAGTIVTLEVPL